MATTRERIGKNGTTYQVQIRIKGAAPQTKTFKRKTEAKLWGQQTEAALRKGEALPTTENRRRTIGELINKCVDGPLKQNVAYRSQTMQLRWWETHLGRETRLLRITPARVMEGKERLEKGDAPSGRPVTQATVRKYFGVLSRAFTMAVKEWYWIEPHQNPFLKIKRPSDSRGRVRFLSDDERERLFNACKASRDRRLYPMVVTAVASGARQGELMNLRWSDVDFERGLALLENTKNGDRRSVPISRPAMGVLKELGRIRHLGSDHIFVNSHGANYFPQKPWEDARRDAEIEDFRFHDLRHTAASYLAMSGATLAEIAEILGHRTLQMVKRYAHLTEKHSHRVASRMAERYLAGV